MSRHHAGSVPPRSSILVRRRLTPPSLVLWRWRHLVIGLCLGAVLVLTLSIMRPAGPATTSVIVLTRSVSAGSVLSDSDVERRAVPESALPSTGLADESVIGSRVAVDLAEGTVLATAMTSASLAAGLSPSERIVQVPVGIGAELAQPGSLVDVVAEDPPGSGVSVVVAERARVVLAHTEGGDNQWGTGRKVTLVSLAVPAAAASLVVGAATQGTLGIVLSP